MASAAVLLVLVLVLLFCAPVYAASASLSDTSPFAQCIQRQGDIIQDVPLFCNNVVSGSVRVLGVFRYPCNGNGALSGAPCTVAGTNYAYRLGLTAHFSTVVRNNCVANITWSVIPSTTNADAINCGSAVDCNRPQLSDCTPVYAQSITVTIQPPTWERPIKATDRYPVTYVELARRKVPMPFVGSSYGNGVDTISDSNAAQTARVLQSTLVLQNDDGDGSIAFQAINDTKFKQGIRLRGCCANNQRANGRFYDCTQDYNKCGCEKRSETKNVDGCATFYCSATSDNPASSYLASTGSCWMMQGTAWDNVSTYEFAAVTNSSDMSISCCGRCESGSNVCINRYEDGGLCNKDPQRFIFPGLTPKAFMQRFLTEFSAGKGTVPMSNSLVAATKNVLSSSNNTNAYPTAMSDISKQEAVDYYGELVNGSDMPQYRVNGVWTNVPGDSISLNAPQPNPQVNALICSYCSKSAWMTGKTNNKTWGPPTGSNDGYIYPDPNAIQPVVTATKYWVLGASPSCVTYSTNGLGTNVVVVRTTVSVQVLSVGSVTFSDTKIASQTESATTRSANANKMVVQIQVIGGTLPQDPYVAFLPQPPFTVNATGNMVLCEAYPNQLKKLAQFRSTNPWNSLPNGCAQCMPDDLWVKYHPTEARILFFWLNEGIQNSFSGPKDVGLSRCTRNGFGDYLFVRANDAGDDCDQVQLNLNPVPRIDTTAITKTYAASKVPPACMIDPDQLSCPCGGTDKDGKPQNNNPTLMLQVAGKFQSLMCMQTPSVTNRCRPSITSLSVGILFNDYRKTPAASAPDKRAQLLNQIRAGALMPDWDVDRPNGWVGASQSTADTPLSLYYQLSTAQANALNTQKNQYWTDVNVDVVLASTELKEVPQTPRARLLAVQYCACARASGPTPDGVLYLIPDTNISGTEIQYNVKLTWDDTKPCFDMNVVIKNGVSGTSTPQGSTAVPFTCPSNPNKPYDAYSYGLLVVTPATLSAADTSSQFATASYMIPSCACVNDHSSPGTTPCYVTERNFNYFDTNGGQVACKAQTGTPLTATPLATRTNTPTRTPTASPVPGSPPTAQPVAPPIVPVDPPLATTPSPTPDAVGPGTLIVPTATLTPSATATNKTNNGTDDGQPDVDDEDQLQVWLIVGLSIAGLFVLGVVVTVAVVVIYYCTKKPSASTKNKKKTE